MHTSPFFVLLAAIAGAGIAFGGGCKPSDQGAQQAPSPDNGPTGSGSGSAASDQNRRSRPAPVDIEIELRGLPDGFEQAALRAAIDQSRPDFSRCYVGRMGARPGLAGTDVFNVSRRDEGFAAQVSSTEMKDAPLARCVLARLSELAPIEPAPASFQLALTFTPHAKASP